MEDVTGQTRPWLHRTPLVAGDGTNTHPVVYPNDMAAGVTRSPTSRNFFYQNEETDPVYGFLRAVNRLTRQHFILHNGDWSPACYSSV
jgi:hypothetical protein